MSESAIRAGKAWIMLGIKENVDPVLKRVEEKFVKWGDGLNVVGKRIQDAAMGILTKLTSAAESFADAGSEIFEMSQKTGVGAEELSALAFAAKQSGASLEDLGAASRGMGRFTNELARGNKTAIATLKQAGIAAETFLAATPEKKLGLIADALLKVEDPGIRSALAMELLGKSGVKLLPMLADGSAGLAAMTAQAREFHLTWSDAEVQKADRLGDAWDLVNDVWERIVTKTGGAIADILSDVLTVVARAGALVIEFVHNNQQLVVVLLAVVTAAAAAGIGLVAFGVTLGAVGILAGGVSTALSILGVILNAIYSPVTLIVIGVVALTAALIAGVAALLYYTETGRALVAAMSNAFMYWLRVVQFTVGGVFDAIMAGNWRLAGEVLMAGLNVAMQTGIVGLKVVWEDFKLWLINLFADMAVQIVRTTTSAFDALFQQASSIAGALGITIGANPLAAIGAQAEAAANGLKTAALVGRNASVAGAGRDLIEAMRRLTDVTLRARADRLKRQSEISSRLPSAGDLATGFGLNVGGGAAAGAFNAAVKGLLHRTADDVGERTATAAEATVDELKLLRGDIAEMGVATE